MPRLCDRTMPSDPHSFATSGATFRIADGCRRRNSQRAEILRRHRTALDDGLPVYADPQSGLSVFTSEFLARRGFCCESGCRHCPFILD